MTVRRIEILTLEHQPDFGALALTFQPPEEELPVGHIVPYLAMLHRAAVHQMDVTHPRFHHDALVRILHEAHTPVGVHPRGHSQAGQIFDLAAANAHTEWVLPPELHQELRKVSFTPRDVTSLRVQLSYEQPMPELPRADKIITVSTASHQNVGT